MTSLSKTICWYNVIVQLGSNTDNQFIYLGGIRIYIWLSISWSVLQFFFIYKCGWYKSKANFVLLYCIFVISNIWYAHPKTDGYLYIHCGNYMPWSFVVEVINKRKSIGVHVKFSPWPQWGDNIHYIHTTWNKCSDVLKLHYI